MNDVSGSAGFCHRRKEMDFLSRTEALLGREAMDRLKEAKVCVFGIGGVGSYALEALVRAGIGKLVLVDHAKVDMTNINRQIIALGSTVGIEKVKVAANRMLDINPNVQLSIYDAFASKKNVSDFIPADTDYIVDAIDSVTAY